MIYRIYYGEISDERLQNWNNGDDDPFSVLKRNIDIRYGLTWMDFIPWAGKQFSDEIKIDWGSRAWKCTGKDILQAAEENGYIDFEEIDKVVPGAVYGVVFIEMY